MFANYTFQLALSINFRLCAISATLMSPARQAPPSMMPPDESWSEDPAPTRRGRQRTNKYGDEGFE